MRILFLVAMLLGPAVDAAALSRPHRSPSHRLARHGQARHPRRARNKRPNLPRDWAWPPTAAMRSDGQRCLATLDALGIAWQPGAALDKVTTPIEIPAMMLGGIRLEPMGGGHRPAVMDCRFAEAMVTTGAPMLRAAGVSALRFSSLYVQRNVRRGGRTLHAISRHALGLALDVFSFVTEDGREHVVLTDYREDPLLRAIERDFDASDAFRHVLTPAKDRRGHRDHFHFEARTLGDSIPRRPPLPVS